MPPRAGTRTGRRPRTPPSGWRTLSAARRSTAESRAIPTSGRWTTSGELMPRDPFAAPLSFGCGLGALERALVSGGVVERIDAYDISPVSLEDARQEAERAGVSGIDYRLGDFNDPQLERGGYDIAFFHQSLHHVSAMERLFRRLAFALKPGGLLYVD